MNTLYKCVILLCGLLNSLLYGQEYERITDEFVARLASSAMDDKIQQRIKGKAILLDFGTTYCAPCISSLKKIVEFIPNYGDSLHVFFITNQEQTVIDKWLNKNRWVENEAISIVRDDGYFRNEFPHVSEPHIVWVSNDGTIEYVTDGRKVSTNTVEKFIRKEAFYSVRKANAYFDFNKHILDAVPLDCSENVKTAVEGAVVTEYLPDFFEGHFKEVDTVSSATRFVAINKSLLGLYKFAYDLYWNSAQPNAREQVYSDDMSKFYFIGSEDEIDLWYLKNKYCVEFITPHVGERARLKFTEFLDSIFLLKSDFSLIERECLMMTDCIVNDSVGSEVSNSPVMHVTLGDFVNALGEKYSSPVVNNLKEFKQKRGLKIIPSSTMALLNEGKDISQLNKILEPLGISLAVQDCLSETLRIWDSSN